VQLFNSLQVFRELTNMIHATEYLCSQRYLCALLHFVPVHFASGVTAHVRHVRRVQTYGSTLCAAVCCVPVLYALVLLSLLIVQSIAQRAEAVEI
jgi:hypothetical protein